MLFQFIRQSGNACCFGIGGRSARLLPPCLSWPGPFVCLRDRLRFRSTGSHSGLAPVEGIRGMRAGNSRALRFREEDRDNAFIECGCLEKYRHEDVMGPPGVDGRAGIDTGRHSGTMRLQGRIDRRRSMHGNPVLPSSRRFGPVTGFGPLMISIETRRGRMASPETCILAGLPGSGPSRPDGVRLVSEEAGASGRVRAIGRCSTVCHSCHTLPRATMQDARRLKTVFRIHRSRLVGSGHRALRYIPDRLPHH